MGRVASVTPSGITTTLSYVPWEGTTFRWLMADVQVIETFKGVQKGEIVRTAMLSADWELDNAPFMLSAEKGDIFFFCVLPTPLTNVFAALTAPYNEALSVIPLHRARHSDEMRRFIDGLLKNDKRYAPLFALTDEKGELVPDSNDTFRSTFASELAMEPSTKIIHLEWETAVSIGGWRSDIPKGLTNSHGSNRLDGPVYSK